MSNPPRSDTFYRFTVAAGLLMALFALAWGHWSLGQGRERLHEVPDVRPDGREVAVAADEAFHSARQVRRGWRLAR